MQNPFSIILRLPKFVVLIALTLICGCTQLGSPINDEAELPLGSITEHPSGQIHPGQIVWHDLLTSDLRVAGNFYEKLFGWQIKYKQHSAIAKNKGVRVAGILELPIEDDTLRAVWLPTVSVKNVDKTMELVKANGGKVIRGPVEMDKRGRAAYVIKFLCIIKVNHSQT